jgi:hypothetical protein
MGAAMGARKGNAMIERTLPFRGLACAGLVMGTLVLAGCHRYDDEDARGGRARTTTTEQTTSSSPAVVAPMPGTTTTTTTTRQTTVPQ